MKGRRVMVMSPAGGFSVITTDLCERRVLPLQTLAAIL